MFQTIGHKHGFVQLSTFGNKETIKAWGHGELLGDSYATIAGAKCAITRHHKAWLASNYPTPPAAQGYRYITY